MAPLPTIGNCIRVGIPWIGPGGGTAYNVLHLITNTTDLEQLASDIEDAFVSVATAPFADVSSDYSFQAVDLTPLDGSTATQRISLATSHTGGTGGNYILNTCALLSMKTNQRGPRGRGRLYLGPISEGAFTNGAITSPGTMSNGWRDWEDEMTSSASVASLGVASYVHAEVNGVTSMTVKTKAATQRRRQSRFA